VKGFKDGVKDGGSAASETPVPPAQQVGSQRTEKGAADSNTVDVEAKTRS
jgi:sec-independent protein translocase protein TatA